MDKPEREKVEYWQCTSDGPLPTFSDRNKVAVPRVGAIFKKLFNPYYRVFSHRDSRSTDYFGIYYNPDDIAHPLRVYLVFPEKSRACPTKSYLEGKLKDVFEDLYNSEKKYTWVEYKIKETKSRLIKGAFIITTRYPRSNSVAFLLDHLDTKFIEILIEFLQSLAGDLKGKSQITIAQNIRVFLGIDRLEPEARIADILTKAAEGAFQAALDDAQMVANLPNYAGCMLRLGDYLHEQGELGLAITAYNKEPSCHASTHAIAQEKVLGCLREVLTAHSDSNTDFQLAPDEVRGYQRNIIELEFHNHGDANTLDHLVSEYAGFPSLRECALTGVKDNPFEALLDCADASYSYRLVLQKLEANSQLEHVQAGNDALHSISNSLAELKEENLRLQAELKQLRLQLLHQDNTSNPVETSNSASALSAPLGPM